MSEGKATVVVGLILEFIEPKILTYYKTVI
jgi:hypothetical protein